jgi:hypothetical protein
VNYRHLLGILPVVALLAGVTGCAVASEKPEAAAAASATGGEEAPSWKSSATAGAVADPAPEPETKEDGEEAPKVDPALTPGSKEFKKALAEAKKKAAEEEKARRKAAREQQAASVKAAKDRAKARKDSEKELSKEEREDWAIREAAFRYIMSKEEPGEVVFISFTPLDSVSMKWNDPPEGFLPRLIDMPLQFRPASQAILTRQPVADPERPNRTVQDPVTKNAAGIYWSEVLKTDKNGDVRVDAGCFRGFMKSWGCILIMRKTKGTWQVAEQTSVWKT